MEQAEPLKCKDCGATLERRKGTQGRQLERCASCLGTHTRTYQREYRRAYRQRAKEAAVRRCVGGCEAPVPEGKDYCSEHEEALADIYGHDIPRT